MLVQAQKVIYDHFISPIMATNVQCVRGWLKRQCYVQLDSIKQSGRKNH